VFNGLVSLAPYYTQSASFLAFAENNKPINDPVWRNTVNVPYGRTVDVVMDSSVAS
jgi:hypothetical protein